MATELVVVIPTFNERDNVAPLLDKLARALDGVRWEVVFVDDDSTDGTVAELERVCTGDRRVRGVRRLGRRGLASAVVEGMLSSFAPFIAVMDADQQHDERLLVPMLEALRRDEADIVVGSRYLAEGGFGNWDQGRRTISRIATELSRVVLRGRKLTDPMSGFFMLKRSAFDASVRRLSQEGYKILLDIVASSPASARIKELPYVFGLRQHGESKLDSLVVLDYVTLLIDKLVGRWVPVRFLMFTAVGSLGILLHMAVLTAALRLGVSFLPAQTLATAVAIAGNFFLNNALTYRDKRLKGFRRVLLGLLSFYAVCAVGAVANVGIANFLFVQNYAWWISGICGILVGAVWNYAASALFTWRR
ncbi:MAG: glycosyltransferase family 2 protein [Hyphomicrobiaceae bacterium]